MRARAKESRTRGTIVEDYMYLNLREISRRDCHARNISSLVQIHKSVMREISRRLYKYINLHTHEFEWYTYSYCQRSAERR